MRRIVATFAALFASTTTAFADPASIAFAVGAFITTTVGGVAASAAVLTAVGYVAIAAVGIGLASSGILSPGIPAVDPGNQKQSVEIKEGGKIYAWGRAKIGGRFALKDSSGQNIDRVLLQCQGECDAYERFFIGEREQIVDTADGGKVRSYPWSQINGNTNAFIQFKLGDGTETAWPELVESYPERWTTDHRIRGIAQMYVRLVSPGIATSRGQELFGDQTVRTDYSAVGRWRKVYDPRLAPSGQENTAWNDRAYYKWSQNGILNTIDAFLLQEEFNYSDVDWLDIATEANKADVLVDTKTGQEPRSRMWGSFETETESRGNILKSILESIDGYVYENFETGLYSIRLDEDNPASEITFTEADHILSYEISPKEGPVRNNSVKLSYYSEELDFELAEVALVSGEDAQGDPIYLPWSRFSNEISRYGESTFDVGLPFCPSSGQGQRKARRLFYEDRARRGVATLNMAGMAAWGKRVITLSLEGLGDVKVRVDDFRVDDTLKEVEIAFIEVPTLTAWNPAVDEADPPEVIEALTSAGDIATPNAPTKATVVRYPNGVRELRLTFNGNVPTADLAEAIYRTFNAQGLPTQYFQMEEIGKTFAYVSGVGNLVGVDSEFRVRVYDNAEDNLSNLSDTFRVTLAEDNTVPSKPAPTGGPDFNIDTYAYTLAIPQDLAIVAVTINDSALGGRTETINVRPLDNPQISGTLPNQLGSYNITWVYLTSNGTRSPVHTETIQITD